MESWFLENDGEIASAALFGPIIVIAIWELLAPRRALDSPFAVRWLNNISLAVVNMVFSRWLMPVAAVGLALTLKEQGFGALNLIAMPGLAGLILGVLLLDIYGYFFHRFEHFLPALWSLHLVHHSDPDMDFTTGNRHHIVEVAVGNICTLAFVAVMGIPATAIILHSVARSAVDIFNHGNINFKGWPDRIARLVLVTPDMHRVHHSSHQPETDSNFGGLFSWWDRMFGTYCAEPGKGQTGMEIGLDYFRDNRDQYLDRLLLQPLIWWRRLRGASS